MHRQPWISPLRMCRSCSRPCPVEGATSMPLRQTQRWQRQRRHPHSQTLTTNRSTRTVKRSTFLHRLCPCPVQRVRVDIQLIIFYMIWKINEKNSHVLNNIWLRSTPNPLFLRLHVSEWCLSDLPVDGLSLQTAREAEILPVLQHNLLCCQVWTLALRSRYK